MFTVTPAPRVLRSVRRLAAGMATVAPRIGDTMVPISLLEKGAYINYQRIEDNIAIVRERSADLSRYLVLSTLIVLDMADCAAH